MFPYRAIIILSIFLILGIGIGIGIWRLSIMVFNISDLFSATETAVKINSAPAITEIIKDNDKESDLTVANINSYYETINETIARLKRDVVVTGAITGTSGQESAMFKIEGMPDREFLINTQLMIGL